MTYRHNNGLTHSQKVTAHPISPYMGLFHNSAELHGSEK